MRLKNDYSNIPWYVSENGMGVEGEEQFLDEHGVIQDDYRIEFLEDHLSMLAKAMDEGSQCFGYHMWTFVDCWSWLNAYKNRYGFYRLNRDQNYARSDKASSYWMKQVIEQSGFECGGK
jgi:6-phospho-beta-glucosidase